ncbi:unnamed protein product [Kuraishia capsulata CBS 1993]|uniref:Uncharacterized protein n=1 Tax=Kuraishia capsulata CBS 1993 TaxID=1382522 RepID=W6MTH7_9ASCO|nr:uncharacterized protein KUCA_T00006024001 [Kuraishia capsulata CBS 1993]CDK30029.1 unnamed protein product [Kuraishia capsulata CBS 1993]
MNQLLLDPFIIAKEYPETLVQTLSFGHSTCLKFNEYGDYLASGTSDGIIAIIDLDTNGIIKLLRSHTRPINSLSWSHDGRYLLSCARDWQAIVWDLSTGNAVQKCEFQRPLWNAEFNPVNCHEIVVTPLEEDPMLIRFGSDWSREETWSLPGLEDDEQKHFTLVSTFHPGGEYVFTGTSKGWINVISAKSLAKVHSEKLTSSNVKNLAFNTSGTKLAVNSSDRIIRQIALSSKKGPENEQEFEFEIDHRYQDVVNKLQWNSLGFNHSGEYLVASTWGSAHDVYMWETTMGSLIKILEGPKEELIDVAWNFRKCTIGATGMDTGTIYLWGTNIPQKWSALAPDFVEIEENIEYEEKEDEFDVVEEDMVIEEDENEVVDVATKETLDSRGFPLQRLFTIPLSLEDEDAF